jgi:hypothetical protein
VTIRQLLDLALRTDHDEFNGIVVESRMISAEHINGITYGLHGTEIAFKFCFEKQVASGPFKHVALV